MKKSEMDWWRASHDLPPRPMDWQDKLVVGGSIIVSIVFIIILVGG